MSPIAPLLFGTDGIRGVAGKYPLEKEFLCQMGRAAGRIYRQHQGPSEPILLLARDTRASGFWIAKAFVKGAASSGLQVVDLGILPTSSLAYLVPLRKAVGGVMISASHNPAAFNGVKLFSAEGRKIPDAWERAMERLLRRPVRLSRRRVPPRKDRRAAADYLAFVRRTVPSHFSLKGTTWVIDCANGSQARLAPAFFRSLGARVIALGARPTGRNINASCGSLHPQRMQKAVLAHRAHGGVAFDGDADRAIFCDEKGHLLDGDHILAFAAKRLSGWGRLKNDTVVLTVMSNLGLHQTLESWGFQVVTTPVGDRYVAEALGETDGVLGGEQSGHIIFREFLPTGDGLLTALQIIYFMQASREPMSVIYDQFKKFPQVLINVPVAVKKPLEECPGLQALVQRGRDALGAQGRVVVRYSGTEPLLRIMMEGPDATELRSLADSIAAEARLSLGTAAGSS